jgi:hypothetical protein
VSLVRGRAVLLTLAGSFVCSLALLCGLAVMDRDISASSDLRRDVVLRDFVRGGDDSPRFADPSPFAVWLPSELAIHRAYRAGDLPLWDRRQAGGYSPLLLLNGVFHPLRLVAVGVPERELPNFLLLSIVWLCFAGFFLLFVECRLSPSIAAVAALSAVLSGYFLSVLHYLGTALALVHLPWCLWLYVRYRGAPSPPRWAAVAVGAALLTASGHPSFVLAVLVTMVGFIAADLVVRRLSPAGGVGVAAAFATGAVAAAPAWLPFFVNFDLFWSYKLGESSYRVVTWAEAVEQVTALLFDRPYALNLIDHWPFYSWIGPITASVALAGLLSPLLRRQLGGALAILPMALFLSIPGPWMSAVSEFPVVRFTKPWYLSAILFGVISILFAFGAQFSTDRIGKRRLAVAVLAIAVLAVQFPRLRRVVEVRDRVDPSASPIVQVLRRSGSETRATGLRGQTLLANSASWSEVDDLRICAPMLLERYRVWLEAVDPEGVRQSYQTLLTPRSPAWGHLAAFGVTHVVRSRIPSRLMFTPPNVKGFSIGSSPNRASDEPADPTEETASPAPELEPILRTASAELYRLRGASPRAFFTGAFDVADSMESAARRIREMGEGTAYLPIVECAHCTAGRRAVTAPVTVAHPAETRVTLEVDAPAEGLVVLNEAFTEGWVATVDGNRTDMLPVSVLSRGILVSPGRHRIEMRYLPRGFILSVALSAIGSAALLFALFRRRAG